MKVQCRGRRCSDILQTASWVGRYFNSFIIDREEVECCDSFIESTLTGNESNLIVRYVMSSNRWSS